MKASASDMNYLNQQKAELNNKKNNSKVSGKTLLVGILAVVVASYVVSAAYFFGKASAYKEMSIDKNYGLEQKSE